MEHEMLNKQNTVRFTFYQHVPCVSMRSLRYKSMNFLTIKSEFHMKLNFQQIKSTFPRIRMKILQITPLK
jgi:hypothetical protein